MGQDKQLTDQEREQLRILESTESNLLWVLLRKELQRRSGILHSRLLANRDHYNGMKDRDIIASLRTLEEVINLPETLAEPLLRKLRSNKE